MVIYWNDSRNIGARDLERHKLCWALVSVGFTSLSNSFRVPAPPLEVMS